MKEGVVELTRVAQDGVKVRASAGASSFWRKKTLRARKREARDQVAALKKELDEHPAGSRPPLTPIWSVTRQGPSQISIRTGWL